MGMPEREQVAQPIGASIGDWMPPPAPPGVPLRGRNVRLEPLTPDHVESLWAQLGAAPPELWTYMAFGPFDDVGAFRDTLHALIQKDGWVPYAIADGNAASGFASYLRIAPSDGAIEIGSIVLSPDLQRTTAATEALFLMMDHVFDLGYRRCEWKCDSHNTPSRQAAIRLGFSYEGTFKKATHYKGRNRDTSWYAIVDDEWPAIRSGFLDWLDPSNFDDDRSQLVSLRTMIDRQLGARPRIA